MLFIPIDVLMMKPKSHLTSGLNHVAWFILHCLVFREQSLVLSNRAAHLSDLFIVSHRFLSVKNFFNFFSKTSWPDPQATSPNRLPFKACWLFSVAVSLSDLYYDTRLFLICQHLFSKKIADLAKKILIPSSLSCPQNRKSAPQMRYALFTIGGGEEIWTPDTAGMNRML